MKEAFGGCTAGQRRLSSTEDPDADSGMPGERVLLPGERFFWGGIRLHRDFPGIAVVHLWNPQKGKLWSSIGHLKRFINKKFVYSACFS